MDKINDDHKFELILEKIKVLEDRNEELQEKVETLEYQKIFDYKDINNTLSNYAQKAIEGSKGPLKPNELQKLLTDDDFNKHSKKKLPIIRDYSNNIDGVTKQILWVYDNVETHLTYRKQQKELDDKLIKKIKKIIKSVKDERAREKSHLKIQSTLDHYFIKKSDKDRMSSEQTPKTSRKRKPRINDESSSSQESGVMHLSVKLGRHLKVNSSENSAESSQSTEMSAEECNSQSTEPMSIENSEGSQSSAEPMSIVNSDASSSQSAMSVDDSIETVKKTKSTKKLQGKVSKQPNSRLGEEASYHNTNEETVPEKSLRLRNKTARWRPY